MTDQDLLEQIKSRFQQDRDFIIFQYQEGEDDLNFSLGDQWPDQVKAERIQSNRPCLTENRLNIHILQVINDIRQTRPSINVRPADDKADIKTAEVLKGIIRNIEGDSGAFMAYDAAADNALRCGFGWLRVSTEYEADNSFDQKLCIEAIENPFSVVLDSASRCLDGSDANHVTIFADIPRKDFEQQYPDADPVSYEPGLGQYEWCAEDTIRIAEQFYKDRTKYTLALTAIGPMDKKDAQQLGLEILQERETYRETIKWCKFTANEILETTEWVGKYIPIIPVYGQRAWYQGRIRSFSIVRQAKDSQRMFNYWKTASTEFVALQPKAPWLAYEGQLTTQQYNKFASANVQNHAVLTHTPVYDKTSGTLLPPPSRQMPPQGTQSFIGEIGLAADGIKATVGQFDASLGMQGNEVSGRAILARQAEGDNATFHFVDNLAASIRRLGVVLVDLIPQIYSSRNVARILGEDGETSLVPLNVPVRQDGEAFIKDPMSPYKVALDAGRYDVVVDIGPSFATKRLEMANVLTDLVRAQPEMLAYMGDILFRSMDFPQAQELAERAKRVMDPKVFGENTPEQAALQEAQMQIDALNAQIEALNGALMDKRLSEERRAQIDASKVELEREKALMEAIYKGKELQLKEGELRLKEVHIAADILDKDKDDDGISPSQLPALAAALKEAFDELAKQGGANTQAILDLLQNSGNTAAIATNAEG